MNKTTKINKIYFSLILLILFLIWGILSLLFSKRTDLASVIPVLGIFGSMMSLVSYISYNDLVIEDDKLVKVSIFSKKHYVIHELVISSVKIGRGPCFIVYLNDTRWCLAYTRNNYEVLTFVLKHCKTTKISEQNLQEKVRKYFFTLEDK